MKKLCAVTAVILAQFSGPVAAQDRMSLEICRDSLSALVDQAGLNLIETEASLSADGWCVIEEGAIEIDQVSWLKIGRLQWRAADMERFTELGLPPRSLEVLGQGISFVPSVQDPIFSYIFEAQSHLNAVDIGLDLRWDGLQKTLRIEDAFIEFDAYNRFALAARIADLDITDQASLTASIGTAGLQDLSLRANFEGWFEAYLLTALAPMLLNYGAVPPGDQVAALQDQATAAITALPETMMSAPSRAALEGFLRALPTPEGQLQIQVTANPPVELPGLAPLFNADADRGTNALETALGGTNVSVIWDGE